MTRVRVAVAGILLMASACGAPSPPGSTNASDNVSGVLDRGPAATCPPDEPCDPPPRATTLIFTGSDGAQFRVHVTENGAFSLHLSPGQYSITTAPPPFGGRVEPAAVEVPQNGPVYLRLRIARSP